MKDIDLQLKILKKQIEIENKGVSTDLNIYYGGSLSRRKTPLELNTLMLEKEFPACSKRKINKNLELMSENNYIKASIDTNLNATNIIYKITDKGYKFLENNGEEEINRVEIVNMENLIKELSRITDTNEKFLSAIIKNLKSFENIYEELQFIEADKLCIMKEKLEQARETEKEYTENWMFIINIIQILCSIMK